MTDTDDGVDKSLWLPADTSLYAPELAAKGAVTFAQEETDGFCAIKKFRHRVSHQPSCISGSYSEWGQGPFSKE